MTFIDVQFPPAITPGVVGGPSFNTVVIVAGAGVEQRIAQWGLPRYRWDIQYALQTPTAMSIAVAFFNVMQGRFNSFRFKDWADYKDAGNGIFISNSNGALTYSGTDAMQMQKSYTAGGSITYRKLTKPIASGFNVYSNGVLLVVTTDYTLDYTMGSLTFTSPSSHSGHTITWTGQYDVHARFDVDEMKFTQEASTVRSWNEIPIVEIRD